MHGGQDPFETLVHVRPTRNHVHPGLMDCPGGGESLTYGLLMLVNQPQKWTLSGVIKVGVFATLNSMVLT